MADTIELGLDPGVITWTPSSLLLGEENVYSDLLYTIDAVLTPSDPLKPNLITNLSVEITDPELAKFFLLYQLL